MMDGQVQLLKYAETNQVELWNKWSSGPILYDGLIENMLELALVWLDTLVFNT
jgi:hypothetical protein